MRLPRPDKSGLAMTKGKRLAMTKEKRLAMTKRGGGDKPRPYKCWFVPSGLP